MSDRKLIGTLLVGATLSTAVAFGLFWIFTEYQESSAKKKSKGRLTGKTQNGAQKTAGSSGDAGSSGTSPEEEVEGDDTGARTEGNDHEDRQSKKDTYMVDDSERQHQVSAVLLVPNEQVGALIGTSGVTIRRIQRESNTRVDFQSKPNGDRVVVIRGRPDDVALAEDLIHKHLASQPIVIQKQLSVPQIYVGRIIGRSGETIRTIQDFSRARVDVDSSKDSDGEANRTVTVKGTQEQVDAAMKLIHDKIEEERNFREKIKAVAANRTQRRVITPPNSNSVQGSPVAGNHAANGLDSSLTTLRNKGVFDVYVSCAQDPNRFWIQQIGGESIDLDKLGESLTEYYMNDNPRIGFEEPERDFEVGDIVASPFPSDQKIYRARVLELLEEGKAEVEYVDYGDRHKVNLKDLRVMMPEFLNLKFQAVEATLNVESVDGQWSLKAIEEFHDLTYCANWKVLSARVRSSSAEEDGTNVKWWIDLMDEDVDIRQLMIQRGYVKARDASPSKERQP